MKLALHDLAIESFETAAVPDGRTGTVHGHEDAPITFRPIYTCPECNPPVMEPRPAADD